MNTWEEMLVSFRQLGGIADNVTLGNGKFGRGLFAIDNTKPVKLQVPKHLLMPVDGLALDDKQNVVLTEACDWSAEAKAFYLDYLRVYSYTDELIATLLDEQTQWFNLPAHVKEMLINYGIDKEYFCAPSQQAVLNKFKRSRKINVDNKHYLMPVVELVNHFGASKHGFTLLPYVGIDGQFKEEVLVNYGVQADAMNFFMVYGFSDIRPYAFSGTLSLNLGPATLNVARLTHINQVMGEVKAPQLKFDGNIIDLSFLLLANSKHKSSPKIIFHQLMQQVGMPKQIASEVFDGLVMQNKQFLNTLLTELSTIQGTVANGLKTMVKHQLIAYGVFV